jgi:hypothetical protein
LFHKCERKWRKWTGSGQVPVKIWNWKKAAVAVRRGNRGRGKKIERNNSSIQNITRQTWFYGCNFIE